MWKFLGVTIIIVSISWAIMITYNLHILDQRISSLENMLEDLTRQISKNSNNE